MAGLVDAFRAFTREPSGHKGPRARARINRAGSARHYDERHLIEPPENLTRC